MTPVTVAKPRVDPVLQCRLCRVGFTPAAPAETEAIGARLAAELGPGDVVLIEGELGAGKTTLVRGACRALGVHGPVTSPTFTIGQRYPAPVPVAHVDLSGCPDLAGEDPDLLADYLRPGHDRLRRVAAGRARTTVAGFARIAARVRLEHAGRRPAGS